MNVCNPALRSLNRQYQSYFKMEFRELLKEHKVSEIGKCPRNFKNLDLLIATGTSLVKSKNLPPLDVIARNLKTKTLAKLAVFKKKSFERELVKREMRAEQYEEDIREGARKGFGVLAFNPKAEIGCTVIVGDVGAHSRSLDSAGEAFQFSNGGIINDNQNLNIRSAFRNAQKGKCGYIYANEQDLKKTLIASKKAGLKVKVLPVWTSASVIASRAAALEATKRSLEQAKGERTAELKKKLEEDAQRKAAEEAQLEARQARFRAQYGKKVASLVSGIDAELKGVRNGIAGALKSKANLSKTVAEQGFFEPFPTWYADKLMKGWTFDSTLPVPADYGIAKWRKREVEAVIAKINVLMKNRSLGEYSDDCWYVGYIVDTEFNMQREPFVSRCKDTAAMTTWKTQHYFETRWDLGVR